MNKITRERLKFTHLYHSVDLGKLVASTSTLDELIEILNAHKHTSDNVPAQYLHLKILDVKNVIINDGDYYDSSKKLFN